MKTIKVEKKEGEVEEEEEDCKAWEGGAEEQESPNDIVVEVEMKVSDKKEEESKTR